MNQTPRPAASPLQIIRRNAIALLTSGQVDKGIALLEEAAAKAPASGELQNDLGTANWQAGRPEKAEAHYKQALALAPHNAFVLNSYGAFLLEQIRLGEAEELLSRAHKADPANPEILNNTGLLHYRRGDMAGAEKYFIAAIRANPQWANPHANIGNVMRDTKRLPVAEKAYQQALKLNPRHAQAWRDMGVLFSMQRRHEESIAAYRRALAAYPMMEAAWGELLDLLEKTSRLDEAAQALLKAKELFPQSPEIALSAAKLLRRDGKAAEALASMETLSEKLLPDVPRNAAFFYELGQLHDRAGDAAKAFAAFTKANACKGNAPAARNLHQNVYPELSKRLCREFTADMATGPMPDDGALSPVFLIGFPRSGTTLLDQIMTSHPEIAVAEENPAVDKMIHHLVRSYGASRPEDHPLADPAYPAALPKLTAEDIAIMRKKFWAEHGGQPAKPVFVDKLPLNILHAGLIARVFPKARFILALRHPCDSVLSCYMQDFQLNSAMARFLDLEESAKFYDEAFTVWEHYLKTLKLDVHAIRYEDVVADFQPTVAKLLEFLDVPWNDAVLEYDKTAQKRSLIGTPSYHQVTQKIYTRASGRWLKYREQLQPVIDILKPHAGRYGYAMTENDEA
jgi:tetratricopeptide (TPR) repeat protein